ncbi:hypothetical protein [Plantibacter sp. RU18]|uniref:hypothetical protein n=1 Tax=Plantibacter sp. RU18 TaxID=3158143 RepID=UPI003D36E593
MFHPDASCGSARQDLGKELVESQPAANVGRLGDKGVDCHQRNRRCLSSVLAAATTLVLAGCTATPASELHVSFERVASVADSFSCAQFDVLQDDVEFYDTMRGFNCVYDNDATLLFRVYEQNTSVQQVLPGWTSTLSETNQILVGMNWFAVGSPELLDELSAHLQVSPQRFTDYEADPAPLTESEEVISACSAFTASEVRDVVVFALPARPEADRTYPGISAQVASAAESLENSGTTVASFEADVSALGPAFKDFCSTWEANRP